MTFATLILADINLTASTVIWWLVVGLIAGFLASVVMRGGGYGIVGDIIIGIVGAFLGGFLASLLGIGAGGFVGTIIIAFIGACILIAILRMVSRSYPRRRL
ncbi:MAG TPA: GlsB/YeaQ/YmgE family stress response membrane protein [Ktedonobacteraceae bacterium]|nr:GlsB/YeaQ/YmgE family stress response membrane protein [Ktedonobacteraceae bacterium]